MGAAMAEAAKAELRTILEKCILSCGGVLCVVKGEIEKQQF